MKRLQADQNSCLWETQKCRGWKTWWMTKMHCTGGDVRKVSLDQHLETSLGRRWCDPQWWWWGTTTPPCVHSNSSRGADRDTRGSTVSRSAPHHQQVLSKAKTRFLAATKTRFLSGWQEDFFLGHYLYFWKTAKKGFLEKLWWRRWRSEAAPPRRLKTGC